MDTCFRDVLEFSRKFGTFVGSTPAVPDDATVMLRHTLMTEEFDELRYAMAREDIPEIADACVDLIYVIVGLAIAYGIDLRPVWSAVHEANMRKSLTERRGDRKVLKPPDFVPPDIAGILAVQPPLESIP
jgi:predicted HAD superfamily Cof-like phosphohydrolase